MPITLISLIGEQPMPVLLPARYMQPTRHILLCTALTRPVAERLARLAPNCELELCEAYSLEKLLPLINRLCKAEPEVIVNLTGGTKFMAMAAFAITLQNNLRFIYLESEGQKSRLYQYVVEQSRLKPSTSIELPALISTSDYLNVHLPGFQINGFSRDEDGSLTSGGYFEEAVQNVLAPHFDVLSGVKPNGVDQQIEIDLVIRCGNQVGIAELKLGDKAGDKPKQGIDQLSTAGSREYLGIYTTKFLITANQMPKRIQTLAKEKNVHLLELRSYQNGRLSLADQQFLVQQIKTKLTGESS